MKLTENFLEKAEEKILRLPGMTASKQSGILVEEVGEDQMYLKFMSDGGITDARNGRSLKSYLRNKGVLFSTTNSDRSLIMKETDFARLFKVARKKRKS